jgi:hypothetical protein
MNKRRDVGIGVGKQGDDFRHGLRHEASDKARIGTVAGAESTRALGFDKEILRNSLGRGLVCSR